MAVVPVILNEKRYEVLIDDADLSLLPSPIRVALRGRSYYPYAYVSVKTNNSTGRRAGKRLFPGEVKSKVRYHIDMPLHRFLLSPDSHRYVDHINGNTLDNRRCNLRFCTLEENAHNSSARFGLNKPKTSRFKGVCSSYTAKKYGVRWRAYIVVPRSFGGEYAGKKLYLGTFDTEEEAAKVWNEAARKYHKEFARLNDVGGENSGVPST